MIKFSNIPAAWAVLRGTHNLKIDTQQRIHDFLRFLPPEHKTPRRILQHLNYTLSCDDLGGTAFCLQALYEGFANMGDPLAPSRRLLQEYLNGSLPENPELNEIGLWLNSIITERAIGFRDIRWLNKTGMLMDKVNFLVAEVKTCSLDIITTQTGRTMLKVPNYNVLIDPYFEGELNIPKFASHAEPKKIDLVKLQNDSGSLYVKPVKGHSEKVEGVTYAVCWLSIDKKGRWKKGKVPSQSASKVNDLDLTEEVKIKSAIILDKIRNARNAYVHDFKELAVPGLSPTLLAYEFFDVFEPIFRELVRERFPKDTFNPDLVK